MTERPHDRTQVVDASVAVCWLLSLHDEAHVAQAVRLFAEHGAGRVHLAGPPHLSTEVGSALIKAVRRQRITPERGRALVDELRRLRIREVPAEPTVLAAWDFAERFGCSYHDAGYLAVADLLGCPFVHADEKLRDKLARRFPNEVWIEDYRPGGCLTWRGEGRLGVAVDVGVGQASRSRACSTRRPRPRSAALLP